MDESNKIIDEFRITGISHNKNSGYLIYVKDNLFDQKIPIRQIAVSKT